MLSDREKTTLDYIDHPAQAGGLREAAAILATASRRLDWSKGAQYFERIGSEPWRSDLAGSPITSRPLSRTRRANACSGWRRETAKYILDPVPRTPLHDAIGYDKNVAPIRQCGTKRVARQRCKCCVTPLNPAFKIP